MNATLERPQAAENNGDVPTPEAAATLVKFSVTEKSIAEAKARHAKLVALPKIPEDDLRRELTTLVHCRTTIDEERKFQNDAAQKHIKHVNSEAKRVTAELAPLETDLQKRWDAIAAEKARVKRERDEAERKAIQDKIDADNAARKAELDAEADRVKAMEAKLLEKQKELDAREAERKAKADEDARLEREREAAAQKERDRLAAIEREKQRQADEAAAQKERDRLAEIDKAQKAKQAELDAKQKAIDDAAEVVRKAQEKADREEFQRQVAIKAEAAAKAKADAERIAAEEAAVKEAERQAELKRRADEILPDKKKIVAWAKQLRDIDGPAVKDAEAKEMVDAALNDLEEIAGELEKFAA